MWFALSLGVSQLMVGLTLVAFGTSAPELVVGVSAALDGTHGIATGAVLGSNIANIGLIIGCSALISPILVAPGEVRFELGFTNVAAIGPLLPLWLGWSEIDRVYGAVLTAYIVVFTVLLIWRHKIAETVPDDSLTAPDKPTFLALANHAMFVVLGLAGLIYGGDWLVAGAANVADELGMSDVLIGVVIVGPGTSLPELATAIAAARKGHSDLALGNVLGSNIFNVGMVLGITALIEPLPVSNAEHALGAWTGFGMAALLTLSMVSRIGISRAEGLFLLLVYAGYVVTEVSITTG